MVGSEKITCGKLAKLLAEKLRGAGEGAALPSYRAIAKEYGVSLSVCQRAVGQLARDGVIKVSQGRSARCVSREALDRDFSFYGIIHSYNPAGSFAKVLSSYIVEAFASMTPPSFPLIRGTVNDGTREPEFAESMCYNHIRGLLLSPATGSENGEYFARLSGRIPVVLFDQDLPGSGLPLLKFDYAGFGCELGRRLHRAKRKKLLVIQPCAANRSLAEFAEAVSGKLDTEIREFPLYELETDLRRHDFSRIFSLSSALLSALRESGCDAVFCPQKQVLDHFIISELPAAERRAYQFATFAAEQNFSSLNFLHSNVWCWRTPHAKLIRAAAERLVRWTVNHRSPRGTKTIPLEEDGVYENMKYEMKGR